jgi:hypothetical protein
VTTTVEVARQEWAEGHRRLEREREQPKRYRQLLAQVDAVTEQLRRRIGGVFTLSELAGEYHRAETWALEAVAELPRESQWPPGLTTATDAAFYLYARSARDYEP